MVLGVLTFLAGCAGSNDPREWSPSKIDRWFEKGEWLNGWNAKPDSSIDRRLFAMSYFNNRDRWDRAFSFLRDSNLAVLELKRHEIDGNNLFASVSEYMTRNEEETRYEAHRKYIDIQHVVNGKELIGIAPLSSALETLAAYDADKDIEFMTVRASKMLSASPERFFIFFPTDAHGPGIKDGENMVVRKVVVKVKID
jgi:YhcH/YjgK/YiaL family protein